MRVAYQFDVRNGIRNQFLQEKSKDWKEVVKNFLRRHQEISFTTAEGLHSHCREVSLLNQYLISFFF